MTDVIGLKDYLERLFTEHEKTHEQLAEGIRVATVAMEKRLDGMNEFRATLNDTQKRTVSRDTFDVSMERLNQNRDQANERLTTIEKEVIGRDVFEQRAEQVNQRLGSIERIIVGREAFEREIKLRDDQLDALNAFRARAMGAATILALCAGVIGAAVFKILS